MDIVKKILTEFKTIAIVGLSPKTDRPSYRVASYLKSKGYRIIPVNPNATEILGKKCYPNLSSIPEKVEVVDIFRRSEDVPATVDEAIKIGAKAIWMQEGIVHEEAAKKAEANGLLVIMNKCMYKEHTRL